MIVAPPPGTYVVQPGDTLSTIARDVLKDASLWPYLASINSIASPYTIIPGQSLKVGVAEVNADKKKGLPWASIIGGTLLLAAGIYWRKDILKFFK